MGELENLEIANNPVAFTCHKCGCKCVDQLKVMVHGAKYSHDCVGQSFDNVSDFSNKQCMESAFDPEHFILVPTRDGGLSWIPKSESFAPQAMNCSLYAINANDPKPATTTIEYISSPSSSKLSTATMVPNLNIPTNLMENKCALDLHFGSVYASTMNESPNLEQMKQDAEIIHSMALTGCLEAEMISMQNDEIPCFKKIYELCTRTRSELERPDKTIANINSQGIPWAMKDFICAFVRMTNSWLVMKSYLDVPNKNLSQIEEFYSHGIRDCFSKWQAETKELMKHLISTFTYLDFQSHLQRNMFRVNADIDLDVSPRSPKQGDTASPDAACVPEVKDRGEEHVTANIEQNYQVHAIKYEPEDSDKKVSPEESTANNPRFKKKTYQTHNNWKNSDYKPRVINQNQYNSWRNPRHPFNPDQVYRPNGYTNNMQSYTRHGWYQQTRNMPPQNSGTATMPNNRFRPPHYNTIRKPFFKAIPNNRFALPHTSPVPTYSQSQNRPAGNFVSTPIKEKDIAEKWGIAQEKTVSVFGNMSRIKKSPEKDFTSGESYEEDEKHPKSLPIASRAPGAYCPPHKRNGKGGKLQGQRTNSVLFGHHQK